MRLVTVIDKIDENLAHLSKMREVTPTGSRGLDSMIRILEVARAHIVHLEQKCSPEGQAYQTAQLNLLAAVVAGNPALTTAEQIEKAVDLADQFFNGAAR